ncbi:MULTISPECIES: GntR family transcriptional regulator [unclassified Chelatococcus]|uniref:GntR family transcriptional regulator n=1 Tax=unclassified Chelatococcus TaxID=2638111 RepID=UPI001BCAACC9|nr:MULTISPECIES: GntR family transcriptional regulator [unclassified Chelatococcus]MBS7698072.1 GntR family transcriptional regulator [Chelatococcus sp. YT9]MBX3556610.1 GntR family transcriptional regulator [Chelatococcus sp.]
MSIVPTNPGPDDKSNTPAAETGTSVSDETLAERAYRLIEDQIISLALPPGMRLTEQELASRLEIGRTPVREALQRLVNDGLVVVFPRKGIAVSVVNPLDVLMALEVRTVLERLLAGGAARRVGPQARSELVALAEQLRAAAEAGDHDRFVELDRSVYRRLGEIASNPFLVRALAPLEAMARRARYYFLRNDDLTEPARLHRTMIEHVVAGDSAAAEGASEALMDYLRGGIKRTVVGM